LLGLPITQIENLAHNMLLWGLGLYANYGYYNNSQAEVIASGVAAIIVVGFNIAAHQKALNTPAPTKAV